MNWILVSRERVQPCSGTYSDWKEPISVDCRGRCIYCSISEAEYGGIDHFHIEHFRPKSLKQFAHLENVIENLFLACAICNRFKSDDWKEPTDEDLGSQSVYLDPSAVDYHQHIRLKIGTALLEGTTIAGRFLVDRLFLNRQQLIAIRRLTLVSAAIAEVASYFERVFDELDRLDDPEATKILMEASKLSLAINTRQAKMQATKPYKFGDTKRLKSSRAKDRSA